MKTFIKILALLLITQFSFADKTVKNSYQTETWKLEIIRTENKDWSVDESVYFNDKKLFDTEGTATFIYSINDLISYTIISIADCGASTCKFRAITIKNKNEYFITQAFGNGADRPSTSTQGNKLIFNFGKNTLITIQNGSIQK